MAIARLALTTMFVLCAAEMALAQIPAPPTLSYSNNNGDMSLTIRWSPSSQGGTPTGYIVEAGFSSGASDFVHEQVNETDFTTPPVPMNRWVFIRVRAFNSFGISQPSRETYFGWGNCLPPGNPTRGVAWRLLPGNKLRLAWSTVDDLLGSSFRIEIGSGAGLKDIATLSANYGAVEFQLPLNVTKAYARVIPVGCGDGPVSEEVVITAPPLTPSTSVVINEIWTFVELKNISAAPIDIGSWRVFTSRENYVWLATKLPTNTIIPAGCSFVLSPDPEDPRDLEIGVTAQNGVAITRPDGMVVDGAGRFEYYGRPTSPFHAGTPLPQIEFNAPNYAYERISNVDTDDNVADFRRQEIPTPTGLTRCGPRVPSAPLQLRGTASGSHVTLNWILPASNPPLLQLLMEVGVAPGATSYGPFLLPGDLTMAAFSPVPDGTYFVRLRATNALGVSPPSNEIQLVVCGQSCASAPGPITQLAVQVIATTVVLTWVPPSSGGPINDFVVEAGLASGLYNLGQFPFATAGSAVAITNVPSGTYYVRLRARNAAGLGPPSNEVTVQ